MTRFGRFVLEPTPLLICFLVWQGGQNLTVAFVTFSPPCTILLRVAGGVRVLQSGKFFSRKARLRARFERK